MEKLPQNLRVEQEILGAILYNPIILPEIIENLKIEDFYNTRHQLIYGAICELFAEGQDINITLIINKIGKEKLGKVGGVTYITELAIGGLSITPKVYIQMIKEVAFRRRAIKYMTEAIQKMYDDNINPKIVLGELNNILISNYENKTTIMDENKLLAITLKEIEKRYQMGGEISGMQTDFIDFDKAVNGLKKGELFVIGGRPSMGKTLMALNLADGLGRNGYRGLIIELEMTAEGLGMRRLAYNSNIEAQKLQRGMLTETEFAKLAETYNYLSVKNNVFTDCSSYQSILTIKAKAKAMKQSHGLDFLIVDHLTLLDIKDKGNRSHEIGEVTRQLKLLAKDLEINVILLCQLSRSVEMRTDKRPMMSDLRESGNIEQDADLIVFAYRDEYYNPETQDKNIMEWIISKQRNGKTGTLKFCYIDKLQKIGNLDYRR